MTAFKLFWSSLLMFFVLIFDMICRSFIALCIGVADTMVSILSFIVFGFAGGGIVYAIYLVGTAFSSNVSNFLNAIFLIVLSGAFIAAITFLGTLLGSILDLLLTMMIWILELIEKCIERAYKSCLLLVDKQLNQC